MLTIHRPELNHTNYSLPAMNYTNLNITVLNFAKLNMPSYANRKPCFREFVVLSGTTVVAVDNYSSHLPGHLTIFKGENASMLIYLHFKLIAQPPFNGF
jgi:hypothetical protein